MITRRCCLWAIPSVVWAGAQETQPSVEVTGSVKQPVTLTADDLAKMPRASVRTTSNGVETVYEGVRLHEVLRKAGARSVRMLTRLEVVQLRK